MGLSIGGCSWWRGNRFFVSTELGGGCIFFLLGPGVIQVPAGALFVMYTIFLMEFLEELKSRVDIVEVLGQYVELKKSGKNYKACCPFHTEKSPSFSINQERGFAYCFGCHAHGDVIKMVELLEGVQFREAVKILADRSGMTIPQDFGGNSENRDKKDRLLEIHEAAAQFFVQELGKYTPAREYLIKRELTPETITLWRIGYAPSDRHALHTHLEDQGYTKAELAESGVAGISELGSDEMYDRFRGRIVFPIADARGTIVAFTARSLDGGEPKYLNSPETPIFTKSMVLFGLDKARNAIREGDRAVVVEGQMDVVACHQAGFCNVVASSGTAVTSTHCATLKKICSTIVLCMDADGAGRESAVRAAELAVAADMTVKVVKLPGNAKDPDEAIKMDCEAFAAAVDAPLSLVDFYFDVVYVGRDLQDAQVKKEIGRELLAVYRRFVSSIEAEDFLGRVAGKLGIREAALRGELKAVPMPRAAAVVAPEAVQGRAVLTREEQLVGLVYGYSERALTLRERLRGMVLGGVCGELLQAWLDAGDVAGAARLLGEYAGMLRG